ncbi:hypothetical protein ACFCVU_27550 [Peribacillus butanolivorans]|uniref:hypothetical protein n=1 Tax=Peribacillus butanolivorans TaxID=421767 RepID=UPI0035E1DB7D
MNKDNLFIYIHPASTKTDVDFFGYDHEDTKFEAPTLAKLEKFDDLSSWLHKMPEGSKVHLAYITLTVSNNTIELKDEEYTKKGTEI